MSFFFQADAGPWPGLILGLLLAAAAFWLYRRECNARRDALRWLLPALRAGALFLVVMILAQPALRHRYRIGQLARLRLVLDASASMGVADADLRIDRKLRIAQNLGWLPADTFDPAPAEAADLLEAAATATAAQPATATAPAERARRFAAELDIACRHLNDCRDRTVIGFMLRQGTLLREYWTGLADGTIESLTRAPDFPDRPAGISYIPQFAAPANWNDRCGVRIRGYLCPPATGEYLFFISADEQGELWLSPDANPASRKLIARVPGPTAPDQWDRYPEQKAGPVVLQAGTRYYVEALHTDGTGPDHLSVGWRLPNGTLERPIPGARLAPAATSLPDPGKSTDSLAERCQKELLNPARALGEGKTDAAKTGDELAKLADQAVEWSRRLREACAFRAQQLAATGDPQIQDALRRFATTSRWQRLQLALLGGEKPILGELAAQHDVELVAMRGEQDELVWQSRAGRFKGAGDLPASLKVSPKAESTNLARPLADAAGAAGVPGAKPDAAAVRPPERQRTAVILLSDGRHNAPGDTPLETAAVLGQRGVNVFTVGVGSGAEIQDLAVVGVTAPESLFFKARVKGTVQLEDAMPAGQPFVLKIGSNGQTLWEQKLETRNEPLRSVEFDFPIEDLVNRQLAAQRRDLRAESLPLELQASVSALPGDRELRNNSTPFRLRAMIQKRRLLLIEGRPRWEWRFVRNIFDTDEQWEVNSVLADWTEAGPAAVRGTTAGRFPADRDNLFAFDLVVLGELPARFFKTDELEWLRDFVGNRGGGLVLLDGRRDSLRGYPGTALEPLLPVEWLRDPVAFRVTRLRPAATQAAQAMLLLTDEPGGNAALWSKFPLPHWNTATKALPGSEILLEAQAPSGECFPAMVLRRFGCGSVLYVAGDELWRLRFNADDRYHSRLWHQMATGLMEKPFTVSDRRVSLDSGPLSYRPGARVEIRARLRDDQGRPLADPHAAVQLWRDGRQVAHLPLVADPNQGGLLRAVSGALEPGAYTVRVEATEIPAAEIKVETSFTVAPPDAGELALLRCQDALLRQMATQTGGRFLREDALGLLPDLVKPLNEGQLIEDETLLWQSYFWFVPIILLLVLEWVLRKKAGLL